MHVTEKPIAKQPELESAIWAIGQNLRSVGLRVDRTVWFGEMPLIHATLGSALFVVWARASFGSEPLRGVDTTPPKWLRAYAEATGAESAVVHVHCVPQGRGLALNDVGLDELASRIRMHPEWKRTLIGGRTFEQVAAKATGISKFEFVPTQDDKDGVAMLNGQIFVDDQPLRGTTDLLDLGRSAIESDRFWFLTCRDCGQPECAGIRRH